jgi:hypothetical protein
VRLADQFGGVEQGLGRDAPAVEADAAELGVFVHEQGLDAVVGGVQRGGIPARAAADDEKANVADGFGHGRLAGV